MKTDMIRAGGWLLGSAACGMAQGDSAAELRKELDALRGDFETRINRLESRIRELEAGSATPI